MGVGAMEGWLYIFTHNRFGLHVSRKRYFILKENFLRSFKDKPLSLIKEPHRSAIIDTSIRVYDNGRENINKKVFFIFTIYNASNQRDRLKLGASSSEEAARWIRFLQDAALKEYSNRENNFLSIKENYSSLRMGGTKRTNRKHSIDWTFQPSIYSEAMASDVNDCSPSPWKIFGCHNGLRLFKEAKDWNSLTSWGDQPVMMAVGVVDGTSEDIFHTLMSLGSSRSEWDFCIYQGSVVDHLDGHTDIIHLQLYNDWPWGMKPRDLLLRRYWKREDDGTYVMLFHSVHHKKCPPHRSFVRASLKSGAYLITPVNKGTQSVVKHMLHIDWKLWKTYLLSSSARSLTIRMLERVAALREMFRTRPYISETIKVEVDIGLPQSEKEEIKQELVQEEKSNFVEQPVTVEDDAPIEPSRQTSLADLNDADEFFDVPEPIDYDQFESEWQFDMPSSEQTPYKPRISSSGLVKKLHSLAVQKKSYMDLIEVAEKDSTEPSYGATLVEDSSSTLPCSYADSDPSLFLVRGPNYLQNHEKVKAGSTLMQLVGADWLRAETRQDDLGGRPSSIVQQYAAKGSLEFFFVVNIQMPGSSFYSIAFYFMMRTPLEGNALLKSFVDGDDAYRNSRFKLIPYISKGSWIVKRSIGKNGCLVGKSIEVNYIKGKNYLEVDINASSSAVARRTCSLVLGYLNNMVVEIAFLIQGNTEEELPEILLGTCRMNYMDASKAFVMKP